MEAAFALAGAAKKWSWSAIRETTDEVLLERIAGGDKRAMQVLFTRHNVRVYRFILRIVGKESVAEELVSEVFLDVWRQAGRFEGRSQVSTWLLAIARFKALSARRQRQDAALDEAAVAEIEDSADTPEMAATKKDAGSLIRDCLTKLSPAHREIVDLVYYHEKSIEEAGEILGIPKNTVKTRMFYARKQLGEMLTAAGIDHAFA